MFAFIVATLIVAMASQQPDTAIYGRVSAVAPGVVVVVDRPGRIVPIACPPAWCGGRHVGVPALTRGMPVWIDAVGFSPETVDYCPWEDSCMPDD